MNRIVRENYPVADLPEDLREGLAVDGIARVVVELALQPVRAPKGGFDLQALYAMSKPAFGDRDEVVLHINMLRGEWDGR